jgi:hypothetical protein
MSLWQIQPALHRMNSDACAARISGRQPLHREGKFAMAFKLSMMSPCVDYQDQIASASALAKRPDTLEGKVIGLVPNWRPAAVHILTAIGAMLKERYHLKDVIMQPVVTVSAMSKGGKLLDGITEQLEALSKRVDIAVTATGD